MYTKNKYLAYKTCFEEQNLWIHNIERNILTLNDSDYSCIIQKNLPFWNIVKEIIKGKEMFSPSKILIVIHNNFMIIRKPRKAVRVAIQKKYF